jgi:hypothetical protein
LVREHLEKEEDTKPPGEEPPEINQDELEAKLAAFEQSRVNYSDIDNIYEKKLKRQQ